MKPVRPNVPPKVLVVVLTRVQDPEVTVTAEVSTVKFPLRVAEPAPVTLLFVVVESVITNFKPPPFARVMEHPLLTVVFPAKVLTPDRVNAPLPVTCTAPGPEMMPAKV